MTTAIDLKMPTKLLKPVMLRLIVNIPDIVRLPLRYARQMSIHVDVAKFDGTGKIGI